jgi:lipopolysaccharide transport system ATP-binding protein
MGDVARQGRTVLFVSHNMGAITRLCTRGVWLERGQLRSDGQIEDVVGDYLSEDAVNDGELLYRNLDEAPGSEVARLLAVRVINTAGAVSSSLDARQPFQIELEFDVLKKVSDLRVGICLSTHDGTSILTTTDADGTEDYLVREIGRHVSRCTVPGGFLNFGQYYISIGCDFPMRKIHFALDPALAIHIENTGGVGSHISDGRRGCLRMQFPWERMVVPPHGEPTTPAINGSAV